MAHQILSFSFKDQQDGGSGYWKLNASVLDDKAYYIAMVRWTIGNLDKLNLGKEKWWDVFLTCIRSKTVYYTKQKYIIYSLRCS